jgi:hypothetical protein
VDAAKSLCLVLGGIDSNDKSASIRGEVLGASGRHLVSAEGR